MLHITNHKSTKRWQMYCIVSDWNVKLGLNTCTYSRRDCYRCHMAQIGGQWDIARLGTPASGFQALYATCCPDANVGMPEYCIQCLPVAPVDLHQNFPGRTNI
jgi:hypothetical protein